MTNRLGGATPRSPFFSGPLVVCRRVIMETEILAIVLGAVLPIYPMLYVIYQKIGKYDEIVEEFRKLRAEHEHHKEEYHGI
jgi:UDP-N-acetylmuramyl pentapeptide phosphotransferase/UDP-N-acetylglucosamine-1-phosphate transferase